MEQHTIYCTKEQTLKALELGAPLFRLYGTGCSDIIDILIISDTEAYVIPTAEQMIGWLESHENIVAIEIGYRAYEKKWRYEVICEDDYDHYIKLPSRKDATLRAIDFGLYYLDKNKKAK